MEPIKTVLANFPKGATIQSPKTSEPEPTLDEKREELRKSMGLSRLENTFQNFKLVAGTGKALAAFKALASGRTDWKLLLCYGGVGNGKTHLCEATALALYKRGIFSRVLTMARIMRALKECIKGDFGITSDALLGLYCTASVFILDDVGMGGSGSEWEFGQLEEIITYRYRERLFTILTTNRDLTELPERIVSRFRDPDIGRIVLNEAPDYRPEKGK